MIHKKKTGISETFTVKFKKGSCLWGLALVILLCLVCTALSAWSVDKMYLLATGAAGLFKGETPEPALANVTSSNSSPGYGGPAS
jgi:hypothetical protein